MDDTIIMLPITILADIDSLKINIPSINPTIGSKVLKIDALEGPIILTPSKNAISATTVDMKDNNKIDTIP